MTKKTLCLFVALTACTLNSEPGEDGAPGRAGDNGDQGDLGPAGVSPFSYTDATMTDISYNDGKVGIGTATPAASLSVNGNSIVGNPISVPGDLIAGYVLSQFGKAGVIEGHDNVIGGSIEFGYNTYRGESGYKRLGANATSRIELSGGAIHMHVGDDGPSGGLVAETPGLAIDTGGYVGVGTTVPWAPLTVFNPTLSSGDQRVASFRRARTIGNGTDGLDVFDDGAEDEAGTRSTVKLMATGTNACNLGMGPTGTDLFISASGSVGVGTTAPAAKFDVVGDAAVSGTLSVGVAAHLSKWGAAPFSCSAAEEGTIALSHKYRLCVCDGNQWVETSDGQTPCTWS